MGCRSWPLCNGHVGLTGTIHALLEQSHRYGAAIVTVLVLATFAAVFRSAERDPVARRSSAAAVALIAIQVALGAITVLAHNAGWTVALHLAGAWLLLAAVTVTTVRVLSPAAPALAAPALAAPGAQESGPPPGGRPRTPPWRSPLAAGRVPALVAAAAVFLLAVSGMFVLHEGASRACPSWPLCLGSSAAPRLVALQYVHRSLGLLAALTVCWAAALLWLASPPRSRQRLVAATTLTALAATAALGGLVATTGASALAQDAHLALASALWLGTVVMASAAPAGAAAPTAALAPLAALDPASSAGLASSAGPASSSGAAASVAPVAIPGQETDLSPLAPRLRDDSGP